jgi:murein L,D-transpeptidase YafK
MKNLYGIGALCLIGLLLVAAQEQTAAVKVHPQNDPNMPDPTSIPESTPGKPRAEAALIRVKQGMMVALAEKKLHWGDPVFLRAFKEEAQLEVFVRSRESHRFELFRSYPIARQSGVLGPKLQEGDGQVPEGFYAAGNSAMKPDSTYHLAINCGYPNAFDLANGRTGSFIMIHGNEVSIGCLAMTDPKIEEIYSLCDAALQNGQAFFRIHLFPFRMSEERMKRAVDDPCFAFWTNIKEGYDFFEKNGIPANALVSDKKYIFEQP